MSTSLERYRPSFIAYIDESGDDGIRSFRAPGRNGSSQWLTLAALIVSTDNDAMCPRWRDMCLQNHPRRQRRDLHFVNLSPSEKLWACRKLADFPVRLVAVMSNKTTIPTHPRRTLFRQKNTLYQYMCRYVLERVTEYAKRKSGAARCGNGKVKIIFSRRGGMSYDAFREYMHRLAFQQQMGEAGPEIYWNYIDIDDIEALDHASRAGLQLADVVASAFSAAVEPDFRGAFHPEYAKILAPRVMASPDGYYLGKGIKPVPRLESMQLASEQRQFFDWYRKNAGRPPDPVPSPILATATLR